MWGIHESSFPSTHSLHIQMNYSEIFNLILFNALLFFSSGQTVLWDLCEHVCKVSAASDYSLGVGVYYFSRSQSTFHSHTHKEHLISRQQQAPLTVGSNSIYCRTKKTLSPLYSITGAQLNEMRGKQSRFRF